MISFFRKIRYQLAGDNQPASSTGRFFNYSRYAIGEIVLVVIGILIALQVNEWNEQRKMKLEEKKALMRLHNESELIVNYIKRRLEDRQLLIEKIEITARALQQKSLKNTSEIDFGMGVFSTGFYQAVSPPRSTFDELKSTGKLQLITSEEIQNSISDFYVNLDYINVQLIYFRNQFTDPISAAPEDYYYTYNPDFEFKIDWNYNFDNLANNRIFVSKLVKALRDQIVFQKYYSEQLFPTAKEMCRQLSHELNVECHSIIGVANR